MRMVRYLILFLSILSPVLRQEFDPQPTWEASYNSLGIPLADKYPDGARARTVWDIVQFEGNLFVASGDYDINAGPVDIYSFHLQDRTWQYSTTINDEQAMRFIEIDNTLYIPGCDPREDWSMGNIYSYSNNQWTTHRNIPGGIHQFDMVEFDGKLFVGLGVSGGQFPIAVSSDNGETYAQVSMYKDGALINAGLSESDAAKGVFRVYELAVFNQQLYAFYSQYLNENSVFHLYKYDPESDAFYYYSALPDTLFFRLTSYQPISECVEYDGKLYFSTGFLYSTADMISAEKLIDRDRSAVTDIQVINGRLYICMISKIDDGDFKTSLFVKNLTNDDFRELYYFHFPVPAQSFTYYDNHFYFGMGDGTISMENEYNGTVLEVHYPLQ